MRKHKWMMVAATTLLATSIPLFLQSDRIAAKETPLIHMEWIANDTLQLEMKLSKADHLTIMKNDEAIATYERDALEQLTVGELFQMKQSAVQLGDVYDIQRVDGEGNVLATMETPLTGSELLEREHAIVVFESETPVVETKGSVSPEVTTSDESNMKQEQVITEIPFETTYTYDDTKEVGFDEVTTKGVKGKKVETFKVYYDEETKEEIDRERIEDSTTVIDPVHEVRLIGTKDRTEVEERIIPHPTTPKRQTDDQMYRDETKEIPGEDGYEKTVTVYRWIDGEIKPEVINHVYHQPVAPVIIEGTKRRPATTTTITPTTDQTDQTKKKEQLPQTGEEDYIVFLTLGLIMIGIGTWFIRPRKFQLK